MLLILIPIAVVWLGVATLVVCLCRMAAVGDAQEVPRGPRTAVRAELLVLERTRGRTHRARSVGRPRPVAGRRGIATLGPVR